MTALTHSRFHTYLDDIAADTPALPPAWALGECDICGTGPTEIRAGVDGMTCRDCWETERAPYDWTDEHDYMKDGWDE